MPKRSKNKFKAIIKPDECKGCTRCIGACPKKVLKMSDNLNNIGFKYSIYVGKGCIGCGACFYNCPEPGAITILEEESVDE